LIDEKLKQKSLVGIFFLSSSISRIHIRMRRGLRVEVGVRLSGLRKRKKNSGFFEDDGVVNLGINYKYK
jgi:hypothetical protein